MRRAAGGGGGGDESEAMEEEEGRGRGGGLVFAYYVTGHGFGHATRVVEVARHLIGAGHAVHIVTGAPEFIFRREMDSPQLSIRTALLDCGAVQSDALTVDRLASLELYSKTAVVPRASILRAEVAWLRSIKANLVVSDVVPIACQAAAQAGLPSVCVSNFSWDFIYSEYMTVAAPRHRSIVWQIAEDYSNALFVVRLPGYCPMPAFRDVVDVPLVVRCARRSRAEVRQELGIGERENILLFNFGGQDSKWSLRDEFLPPGWKCWVCGAPDEQELGSRFMRMDRDAYTPDLIAASDCMLGKIGYGTVSEVLAFRVPFVFIRRDYFNEEPFLRKMLDFYRGAVEMNRRDFFSGRWAPYLGRARELKPRFDGPVNGGEVVARILQDAAVGKVDAPLRRSGSRRLQDAIIFGFQMQRHPSREIQLPDWYATSDTESGSLPAHARPGTAAGGSDDVVQIVHGSSQGLADTAWFLRTLGKLDEEGDVLASDHADRPQAQERLPAAGLFRWDDDVVVCRAPGRLDVMGGIADYSGSLVLQMPIREACHVAVQLQPATKQRLWKHMTARHGGAFKPAVRIVSFGSELANRAPTFDMDVSDFFDAQGKPISYEAARAYFEQDPSRKWAAYVAGTLLVLIRERGVEFRDGLSILVSSAVPEGKGVSSSAALEVATMSAVTAALGVDIAPNDLATLCQMVENYVVGAPCGIMDQMAATCGEANKLLAMVCQPADVKEHINIPSHVRFWGLDSGIRHSVGGSDYGSVRVGTFMGRRIIQAEAAKYISQISVPTVEANGTAGPCRAHLREVYDSELREIEQEINLNYLCNIPPSRYDALYAGLIPAELKGQAFFEKYGSHNDPVTRIKLESVYKIRAPTSHPVYENSRVKTFAALLTAANSDEQLSALGELMYQSHTSYSNCGLGSKGTDLLVSLTKHMQRCTLENAYKNQGTLFGAKISGGGCGGTVCIIGRDSQEAYEEISKIQQLYVGLTGHKPYLFEGSSPGAAQFGYLRVRRTQKCAHSTVPGI
ncbi:hypothetical protein Mp_1g06320 [Marchantia polymorpha subsp. ruderalis]|uniref:L-arabinokinase n=1 Tax=Marchantia polymorpha subsp. ruderalis TaxID=1480154 RepID=A0AAF6AM44_MARPO|nr:hypothetical protein Mp_1g06320 [Marchantia polymorpha subsp. ruderalis]BBM97513.1 hypothetical protein Mp_1g06320 [Marchantia polymorpha subsp. ruderalis]BBM97514.1 hypothetical protein Mp_1g06320 [Marchantia polymorpha subsp. ruderalis]